MVDIRFEGDYRPAGPQRSANSRMTQFFIDHSFGLVQTPAQASVVQIILCIIFFIIAGMLFSKSGEQAPPSAPSQQLIDAPQPTRPLN